MSDERLDVAASTGMYTAPGPATEAPKTEAPKKLEFTQEELDRIIAERVSRAKPKDYDDLVKLRDERAAAAEVEKTELQREKDARKEAERAAKEMNSKANAKLIRAALLTEATAQDTLDADIVVTLLTESPDIEVDDAGEVHGVKEAVAKLLKDKPILVRKGPSSSGGEFGGNDPKTRAAKIAELERKQNDTSLTLSERQRAGRDARELKFNI
jgi:hypothetical protein